MTRTVTLIAGEGIGPEIAAAVFKVYREGRWPTPDVGGKAKTAEFTQAVIDAMK